VGKIEPERYFVNLLVRKTMKRLLKGCLAVLVVAGLSGIAAAQGLAANDVYKTKCAGCHGPNGEGKPAMKIKPMKDYASMSDAELTSAIENGKKDSKPPMPAYKGKLTDAQVKDLVAAIKASK
jgi:cytochrome c6